MAKLHASLARTRQNITDIVMGKKKKNVSLFEHDHLRVEQTDVRESEREAGDWIAAGVGKFSG